ncbi:hypothetical protein D3C84_552100 [compost metagenome]
MEGQAVVDQAELFRRIAPRNEGVEAVEPADAGETQDAALGSLRVDPGEVGEVGRVLGGFVVEGDGVLGFGHGEAGQGQQQGATALQAAGAQRFAHRAFSVGFSHQARRPRV